MHIEHFIQRLEGTFPYHSGRTITRDELKLKAKELNIHLPEKVKIFCLYLNGLIIENPAFEVIDINNWTLENDLLHFATFNKTVRVCFQTQSLNSAGEWTILNPANNYELTLTISSFWSNKIWKWLQWEKEIWEADWFNK